MTLADFNPDLAWHCRLGSPCKPLLIFSEDDVASSMPDSTVELMGHGLE